MKVILLKRNKTVELDNKLAEKMIKKGLAKKIGADKKPAEKKETVKKEDKK